LQQYEQKMNSLVTKYFPELTASQVGQFEMLHPVYDYWNSRINVISRKDMDNFTERHVLHSLGIAKVMPFKPGTTVLDVGTGGGFPGIPLAIMYPDSHFLLVDSIGKKIKVVDSVIKELKLENAETSISRAETLDRKFNFIVSRAVTSLPIFLDWVRNRVIGPSTNQLKNGILYLKGGDLTAETENLKKKHLIFELKDYFDEPFFETKKVIHIELTS
jgi:16S rRNA (guanine527-N7)-methyltransferase